MVYLRIDRNKFWGWVIVSLAVGLLIGLGVTLLVRNSANAQVADLKKRLSTQTTQSTQQIGALQEQLASRDASIAGLTQQNSKLASDLASANAKLAQSKTSSGSTGTVSFVSRSVSPESVDASGSITLTVKIKGHPDKVRVQIIGTSYDKTFYLTKASTSSSGVETWRRTIKAPSKKGTYRYYAGAFKNDVKTTMSGTSGYSFQVK